jgi:hypothetical protein
MVCPRGLSGPHEAKGAIGAVFDTNLCILFHSGQPNEQAVKKLDSPAKDCQLSWKTALNTSAAVAGLP